MQLHLFFYYLLFSSAVSVHRYVISSFTVKENKFCLLHTVSIFVHIDFKEEIENKKNMEAHPFLSQINTFPALGFANAYVFQFGRELLKL